LTDKKSQVQRYMQMDTPILEETLAREFSVTIGVDISAATNDRDRKQRLDKAVAGLRSKVAESIKKSKTHLKKVACGDLKYCERRETAIEVLVLGLVDAGIAEFTRIPLPTVAVFVYIVKTRMLDPLCQCRMV
jgi:hypothetical protein